MAEFSFPHAGVDGDRKYGINAFARLFVPMFTDGVFPSPSDALQVVATGEGMQVAMKAGDAVIAGNRYWNTADLIFTLAPADGVLNRIDRICVRWDREQRRTYGVVKSSTPASSPVAPDRQYDEDRKEIVVADVLVGRGVTSITQSAITDQRLNTPLGGIVATALTQIDTASFNAQLQAWFAEYMQLSEQDYQDFLALLNQKEAGYEADWTAWFDSIKGQLSDDAATNLYNMITSLTAGQIGYTHASDPGIATVEDGLDKALDKLGPLETKANIALKRKAQASQTITVANWVQNTAANRYEYTYSNAEISAESVVDISYIDADQGKYNLFGLTPTAGAVKICTASRPSASVGVLITIWEV